VILQHNIHMKNSAHARAKHQAAKTYAHKMLPARIA